MPRREASAGFPTDGNSALIALANALGDIIPLGRLAQHPLEDDFVYRVECKDDGLVLSDGSLVHSTAPAAFACHTDGFGSGEPPQLVLLLCVRPDLDGGDTVLVRLDDVLPELSAQDINLLRQAVYPNGTTRVSILFDLENGKTGCRFNLKDLLFCVERVPGGVDEPALEASQRFSDVAESLCQKAQFKLLKGDCLVIGNKKVLHGRTAISKDSGRLLKRVRVYNRLRKTRISTQVLWQGEDTDVERKTVGPSCR